MNWKIKAGIQNMVAILPSALSYELYYWMQKQFGGYKYYSPKKRLKAGFETWNFILKNNIDPINKIFFEIGTGRVPTVPIAFYLLGAKKTITLDLNPYFEDDLTKECLRFIIHNRDEVCKIFDNSIIEGRFNDLRSLNLNSKSLRKELLEMCNIEYYAPADAAKTPLNNSSIDFHTSFTVFEHIPLSTIKDILQEGNRIIKNNGLFIHYIDYADHFAQTDKQISEINFLQYDDKQWHKYAGNRYMFMNRLRHDDFIQIFNEIGHNIIQIEKFEDYNSKKIIETGSLKIDKKFEAKSNDILCTTKSWFVTKQEEISKE